MPPLPSSHPSSDVDLTPHHAIAPLGICNSRLSLPIRSLPFHYPPFTAFHAIPLNQINQSIDQSMQSWHSRHALVSYACCPQPCHMHGERVSEERFRSDRSNGQTFLGGFGGKRDGWQEWGDRPEVGRGQAHQQKPQRLGCRHQGFDGAQDNARPLQGLEAYAHAAGEDTRRRRRTDERAEERAEECASGGANPPPHPIPPQTQPCGRKECLLFDRHIRADV